MLADAGESRGHRLRRQYDRRPIHGAGDTLWRPLGGGGRRTSCSVLLADLRPGDGKFDFLAGLQRGEAVLEVFGSLDHCSVLLDIDEDRSKPPTLRDEEDFLTRTKLVQLPAKLASQVVCGNNTGNRHLKPIVDPMINRRVQPNIIPKTSRLPVHSGSVRVTGDLLD